MGPVRRLDEALDLRRETGSAASERSALQGAIAASTADLAALMERVEGEAQDILGFQVAMLEDDALSAPALIAIVDKIDGGGERRRSGRKVLTQDLEHLPPAAALVKNLTRPDYVDILCGSIECLDRAFAELDAERRHQYLAGLTPKLKKSAPRSTTEIVSASLPSADRRLIRSEAMNRKVKAVAGSIT